MGYRKLNTLIEKAKQGNKILTLIIDPFMCNQTDKLNEKVECYNKLS